MSSITITQLEIVKFLLKREEPQNIRGLARKLHKSYPLVYNNLADLQKRGIIVKQNIPPAQIITLHEKAPLDILIEAERGRTADFLHTYQWLQLLVQDVVASTRSVFFCLVIFGSYAKGKQTKQSDLDILAIVPNKEDIAPMEEIIAKTYTKIKKQILVVTEDDFLKMIRHNQQFNVGNEAVKHHIIGIGFEQFYYLLRKARL